MSKHTLDPPAEITEPTMVTDVSPDNPDFPDLSSILNKSSRGGDAPEPEEDSGVDESLLNTAKDLGFDDDDLAGLDAARIERMVAAVDRRAVAAISKMQSPMQVGMMGQAPAGLQPPAGAPTQPQQPPGFKIDLSPDEYDDKLVATLQQMNEYWQQQFANLSLQQQQQLATVGDDSDTRWFDDQFSGLGEEYASVFGNGRIEQLREGSAEEKNRFELFQTYNALRQIHPQTPDDVLFQRALRASFGHVAEDQAKKKLVQAAKQRSKTTIGRPSGRQSPSLERDPQTGLSTNTIDAVQRAINSRLNR
jgi:hypothetical protein